MKRREIASFIIICLLYSLSGFTTELFLSARPAMSNLVPAASGEVQLLLISFFLGLGIAQLIFAPLSDRYGRKPLVMIALGCYCLSTLMCIVFTGGALLHSARFIQALSASACLISAFAILRDRYSKPQMMQRMAMISLVFGVCAALLPFFGGYMTLWFHWHFNFFVLFLLACAVYVGVLFYMPESLVLSQRSKQGPNEIWQSYWQNLKRRSLRFYSLATACGFTAFFIFIAFSPFIFMNDLGYSAHHYAILLIVMALAYVIGAAIAAFLAREFEAEQIAIFGAAVIFLSGVLTIALYVILGNELSLGMPFVLSASGMALLNSGGTTSVINSTRNHAHAATILQSMKYILASLSSLLLIFILHAGVMVITVSMTLLGFMAVLLFISGMVGERQQQALISSVPS